MTAPEISDDMTAPQIPDNTTLKDLYDRYVPQLLTLATEGVKQPLVVRERALELSQNLHREFVSVLPELKNTFAPSKIQEIQTAYSSLIELAFVFYFASMEAEKPFSEQEKAQFQTLAVQVRDNDSKYMKWARAIFHGDEETNAFLDKVQADRGYQDDAEDVLALTHLLLTSPKVPRPNPFFTEEDLRKAEADSRLFLWLLLGRDQKKPAIGSPSDMRNRAYTLWFKAYDTVAQAGRTTIDDEQQRRHRFPKISPLKTSTPPQTSVTKPSSLPNLVDNFGKS